MRLGDGAHLTYCTSIHAAESWPEVRTALERHVTAVKAAVCPERPFGVGLRLSAQAAAELDAPQPRAELERLLTDADLYVFTLNGFPYGAFSRGRVKEAVYLPDWRSPERGAYSDRLARLLATLLPADEEGSVSTVPGAFKPEVRSDEDERAIADGVLRHVAMLHRLRQETGKTVAIALEPEPECYLETTDDAVRFFQRFLQSERGVARLAEAIGGTTADAARSLERHAGVCLDACHAAVEYEDPQESVELLDRAGVPIKKLQLSAGLRIERMDGAMRDALEPYRDEVYLHQVVERRGGTLTRHLDLDEALRNATLDGGAEWRIHFHVPIFLSRMRHFASTQDFLRRVLALQRSRGLSRHLEVETYTWDVLPAEARPSELTDAIASELRFCLSELGVSH